MPKSSTTWQKGVSGNLKGRSPFPPEVRAILVRSREELIHLYESCTNRTKEELELRMDDPAITMLEATFLKAMLCDLEAGTTSTLEKMIERIHGKTIQPIVANIGVMTLEQLIAPSASQIKDVPEIGKDDDEDFIT